MKTSPSLRFVRPIAQILAVASAGLQLAHATPYATCLTNNAGLVSFRLNQTTVTNDTIWVISSAGAVTNVLQSPGDATNNFFNRGLIVTNLGIASGAFKVYIKHVGSGVISTNSPRVPFGNATISGVRGIGANVNPASPYFGWVYVANSQTNLAIASRGDGIFAFGADIGSPTSDILGQGNVPKTGGYNFGVVTIGVVTNQEASSPFKVSVAPDDSVLVSDWSDVRGNLISMDPLLNSFSYVLAPLQGTAAAPVGSNNNHGSLSGAVIVGTGANRVLYTSDEDYQTDPAAAAATEWNSIWRYDIGNNPLPWSNAPNRKLMTPFLASFAGQNQKVEVVGNYLYANQRRANFPQHDVYVVDLNNLQDPSTFSGITPWGATWTSQDASLAEGYNNDILRDAMSIAVSPDGKWFAAIIAAGSGTITAPDGSTFSHGANDVILCPLTNGIPHLAARQRFAIGGTSTGRDVAFDAAHNLYWGGSGVACVQSLDIGESTEATTDSSGTFSLVTPATQVSATPSTPVGFEQGTTPAVITLTRTVEDLGNPVTIFYTITGSASNGVDYALLTNRVTLAAGQSSTNIAITPVDDSVVELSETVVLTILGSGGYSVGFPLSATITISDNETPQLQIVGLSTNIYQGNSNDYAGLTLRRLGQTNALLSFDNSSFSFGGSAVQGVDYYVVNLPFFMDPGVITYSNAFIYPIDASTAVGSKSIVVTALAGFGYTVTNNTATSFITLKAVPPGTVLFSDNFEIDPDGTNWNVCYGTLTNGPVDYTISFNYDYTAGGLGNLAALPAAPHSTSGDTKGLFMTVNKSDGVPLSAALNLYLKNHTFSNDYALRFDMLLVQNSSSVQQSKNETALCGINHAGTRTNWIRNSVLGTGLPKAYDSDGLFTTVEADASTTLNFAFWSGPTWTNGVSVVGPTNFMSRLASTTRQVFKKPPFDAGPALGGVPANTVISPTPCWVTVELSQIGKQITWKLNNTVILTYYNTNAFTASYTNGTIMLGYNDPWDDIGNGTAGSGEAAVVIDNVRVVTVAAPTILTQPISITAPSGTVTNLSVVASTTTGVTNYQWTRNGADVLNATNATLSFSSLALSNYGTYVVYVNDGAYTTVSASVTVLPPAPVVVSSPTSRAAVIGSAVSFSGSGATFTSVTNYQWMRGSPLTNVAGVNYSGITNTTLNIATVQSTNFGPYALRISDGLNFTTSSIANLTLAVSPVVTNSLSGSTLNLTFPTEVGPQYIVEWKGALTNGVWTPMTTNNGTGSAITIPASTVPDLQRFFRVRLR